MSIKGTLLGGCALLGMLTVSTPVQAAEQLEVKPLIHQTKATVVYPYDSSNPYAVDEGTTLDDGKGVAVQEVSWRGRGWGRGGWGRGWGRGGWGVGWRGGWGRGWGVGFRGYRGYYGRGYYPGYYGYAQPYYGYSSYYPSYYGGYSYGACGCGY